MRSSRAYCSATGSVLLMKLTGRPNDLELIDLVLHQGDQRRDDQRQAVQGQGGQLVAEALSAAGGHDAQAILPGQDRRDDFLLPMAERSQAELGQVGFQRAQADTSAVNQWTAA